MDNKEYFDHSAIPFGRSELRFPDGSQLSAFRMGDGKSRILAKWSDAGDYTVSFGHGYGVADPDWNAESSDEKFSDPDFQLIFDNARSVDAVMVCLKALKDEMTSGEEVATDEKMATGQHYKLSKITEDDIGTAIGVDFLAEKMQLSEFQCRVVHLALAGLLGRAEITKKHVGLNFDPYLFEAILICGGVLTEGVGFIDFSIFKKIVRFGNGDKSEDQDRADIIGACRSGIELTPNSMQKYTLIINLMSGSDE